MDFGMAEWLETSCFLTTSIQSIFIWSMAGSMAVKQHGSQF